LRQTLSNREGGADPEEFRVEQVVDRTAMFGEIWLGLTVGCARCHDHKSDPISQREFYQWYAFFNSADERNIDAPLEGELENYLEKLPEYQAQRQALLAPVTVPIAELQARWEARLLEARDQSGKDHVWDRQWEVLGLVWGGGLGEGQLEGWRIVELDPARRSESQKERLLDYFLQSGEVIDPAKFSELKLGDLHAKLKELKSALPQLTRAPAMCETQIPRETHIHVAGDFRSPGDAVQPATPAFLPPLDSGSTPDRLALARWLVSPHHPLTARVAANRMWQELFGRGLAATSADFGVRGDRPTHPELLDWLAAELIRSGWDIKHMHRLIVTSETYCQSSFTREELRSRDPDNRLLARQTPLRLSAEQIRDAALAVSGQLDARLGGPSVRPPQPDSVSQEGFDNQWIPSPGRDRYRRGLYTFIQRTSPFAMHVTFDGAHPARICPRRERSNTPLQALLLLNDPVFFDCARALALRTLRESPGSDSQRMELVYRLCTGRRPLAQEEDRLAMLLNSLLDEFRKDPQSVAGILPQGINPADAVHAAAWTGVCSVLLNLHEFITRG
jgi:hypothetical protein